MHPDLERSGALVVANADAGSHDDEALETGLAPLRQAGVDVEVAATSTPEEVRRALGERDGRAVVAAGGDGTLHVVVQALHDLDALPATVVGLLPLGTGNDFARAAGLPLDPADAGRLLLAAEARTTDLVVDEEGTVLVNAAHAGVSADASQRASDLKDGLGPAAYPVGAFLEGITTTGFAAEVELDGQPVDLDGDLLLFGVGNGPTIGGGTPLFPDARLDDGRAEVLLCMATGALARVGFAAGLRDGRHADRDDVVVARAAEVVVRSDPVRHCVDGEVSEPVPQRRYRVLPGAWRALRPERPA